MDKQIGGFMQMLHPFEIVAPIVQLGVLKRHRVNTVGTHVMRMRYSLFAVYIELSLQQGIHCRIEIEGETGWAVDAQPAVKVKTTRALDEAVQPRATKFERLCALWIVEISLARRTIGHKRLF
jgi:hypothetical protein